MDYDLKMIFRNLLDYVVGAPMIVLAGSTLCMVGLIAILSFMREGRPSFVNVTSWRILFLYLLLVLCVTLIFRDGSVSTGLNMQLFWAFKVHDNRMIAEVLLNILIFVPLGFLACGVKKNIGIWKVCSAGSVLSLTIELLQLFTKRGVCNINDVINNTLGCAFGYGIFHLFNTLLTAYTKNNVNNELHSLK